MARELLPKLDQQSAVPDFDLRHPFVNGLPKSASLTKLPHKIDIFYISDPGIGESPGAGSFIFMGCGVTPLQPAQSSPQSPSTAIRVKKCTCLVSFRIPAARSEPPAPASTLSLFSFQKI